MLHSPRVSPAQLRRPDLRKRQLSVPRQRLVLLAQRLGFGVVHGLHVRGGEPVLDPPPRIVCRRKNGCAGVALTRPDAGDFALRREWVDFFADLDAIGDGVVVLVEVAHGAPIVHEFEDAIPV